LYVENQTAILDLIFQRLNQVLKNRSEEELRKAHKLIEKSARAARAPANSSDNASVITQSENANGLDAPVAAGADGGQGHCGGVGVGDGGL
jgi:hypothetical protein